MKNPVYPVSTLSRSIILKEPIWAYNRYMNPTSLAKSTTISFSVPPDIKAIAEEKAREQGMTISELGRSLFRAFATSGTNPPLEISPEFLAMEKQARRDYKKGKGRTFDDPQEAIDYLHNL